MRDLALLPRARPSVDQVVRRSFGVLETALVALIVTALAVGVAPVYVSYTQAAKAVEGKLLATSLWSAIEADAIVMCGRAVVVAAAFSKVGLDQSGSTTTTRWTLTSGAFNSVTMDCATGAIRPDGDVFTLAGAVKDIGTIRVKVSHEAAASPMMRLLCSVDGGRSFGVC